MLKKIVKPCVFGLGMMIGVSAMATTTGKKPLPGHSIKTHLIKPPVMMPGPVMPSGSTAKGQLPKRGIGPIAVVSKMKRVVSKENSNVSVLLPVNKSTGDHWEILSSNDNLIKVLGHKYLGPVSEIYGAPGHDAFNFKALGPELGAPRTTHIIFALIAADGHIVKIENVSVTSTGA
jgi:hypothetical protein